MTVVELVENGPALEVALSRRDGAALADSGLVIAAPTTTEGWWSVSPASTVGVARVGGVELWVAPKLPIRRLLFLLGFARSAKGWRDEDIGMLQAPNLLVAVAEAFARQATRALAQGLLQGYRSVEEALPVVRGRLREADQLRRRHGLPVPLEVRYDDFTIDIAENQLLRAASERLLRLSGLPNRLRASLLRVVLRLGDVVRLVPGHPLPRWQASRLNTRYHVALRLAELVLRGGSVERESGTVRVSGFMVAMNRVFEDFVTVALGEALTAYGGFCRRQDRWHLDEAHRIGMQPDLVWYEPSGQVAAVMDAKYKAAKPSGFPEADLYQMLAYCTVLGMRRGHLIYAKGNEPATAHTVRNTGIEIVQHALDLDRSPRQLLVDVEGLAASIASSRTPARVGVLA